MSVEQAIEVRGMKLTDKQKLWLKVVLFITTPVWIPAGVVVGCVAVPLLLIWTMVDEMVDPPKHGGRLPPL